MNRSETLPCPFCGEDIPVEVTTQRRKDGSDSPFQVCESYKPFQEHDGPHELQVRVTS